MLSIRYCWLSSMVSTPVIHKVSFIFNSDKYEKVLYCYIPVFRVVGCLGLLSCLLIRSYFHISVPSLKMWFRKWRYWFWAIPILYIRYPPICWGNRGMTLNPVRIISIPISIYAWKRLTFPIWKPWYWGLVTTRLPWPMIPIKMSFLPICLFIPI
mgnify:CR=1 FL=1